MLRLFLPPLLVLGSILAQTSTPAAETATPSTVPEWLKKGHDQYERRQYKEARASFEEAGRVEPNNVEAKLGLASASMKLWVIEKGSPDRENYYFRARNTLLDLLDQQPDNQKALGAMSRLSLQRAISARDLKARPESMEEARSWNLRLIALDPHAVSAHYALGVITWLRCVGPESQSHNPQNIPPSDSDVPPAVQARLNYRAVCQGPVEEGIWHLNQALELEPDNYAAMGYLGALYGMKAGYEDLPEDAQRDHATSGQWAAKAEAIKKSKFDAGDATTPGSVSGLALEPHKPAAPVQKPRN